MAAVTQEQKVLGLIGGMSWQSSALYYRLANELVAERLGALHSARLVLASVDFAPIEALQVSGEWDEAGRLLAEQARGLQAAGADLLLICSNTMHLVADQVQAAVTIPLLHVVDVTAAAALRGGYRTVGLLGTAFTMQQPFYRDRLAGHGLQVLVPAPAEQAEVHRIIYTELVRGHTTEPSRQMFRSAIESLVRAGAQAIVLGCTELELLLAAPDSSVPLLPTTRLHVEAGVAAAITGGGADGSDRLEPDIGL
jgi:aspartate racemase